MDREVAKVERSNKHTVQTRHRLDERERKPFGQTPPSTRTGEGGIGRNIPPFPIFRVSLSQPTTSPPPPSPPTSARTQASLLEVLEATQVEAEKTWGVVVEDDV